MSKKDQKAQAPASDVAAKAQPIASTGVALVLVNKTPMLAITQAPDGTFGWRTRNKMPVKTRSGKDRASFKATKGFATFQDAVAGGIVFLRRKGDVPDAAISIAEYVPLERGFGGGKKRTETPEFIDAVKIASKLKLPKALQLSLSNGVGSVAPAKAAKKTA